VWKKYLKRSMCGKDLTMGNQKERRPYHHGQRETILSGVKDLKIE